MFPVLARRWTPVLVALALLMAGCRSARLYPAAPSAPIAIATGVKAPAGGGRTLSRRPATHESFWDLFKDDQDGQLDFSEFMARPGGFLPVAIPITEPAVGLGLVGAATFFHRRADPTRKGPSGRPIQPSVSVVGGLATENGTWGAFAGHMGIWNDDRIRYTGGLFHASVNLDYYGIVSDLGGASREFNIEGSGTIQDIAFRLGDTDLFVGARYQYFNNEVAGQRLLGLPGLEPIEFNSTNAGLGVEVTFDTRDNPFTPSRGYRAQALLTFFEPELGGDFSYQKLEVYGLGWFPLTSCLNWGLRLDGKFVQGAAPFYALPFIQLRGVPAMRYLGDDVIVAETELRWDLNYRWSLVGFGGAGRASRTFERLFREDRQAVQTAWNGGGGFRYLISRAQGLRMGIDVARGPEDWAFYVTVGSGWLRL